MTKHVDPAAVHSVNLQPGHGKAGRHPTRAFLDSLSGHKDPGKFGRMFPTLPPLEVEDDALQALAEAMKDTDPASAGRRQPERPGRLHLPRPVRRSRHHARPHVPLREAEGSDGGRELPHAEPRSRQLYGLGPDGSPHLYARNPDDRNKHGPKFLIGKNITVDFGNVHGRFPNDLPRSPQGFALIGDHRNDENLLVAQTHLALLKFHNKVVDLLAARPERRRRICSPRRARSSPGTTSGWCCTTSSSGITEDGIVDKILHEGRKFYRFKKMPYMPVEFSAAAYRLGHSMVRRTTATTASSRRAGFSLLFRFTGLSGDIIGDLAPNPPTGPTPSRRCRATGSSTGAASTTSRPRRRRTCAQPCTQDRPVPRRRTARASRRRRRPRLPQPAARRQSRPAVRPGCGARRCGSRTR